MDNKGIYLLQPIDTDSFWLHIIVFDFGLFEASLLDLLPSLPKTKLQTLKDNVSSVVGGVIDGLEDVDGLATVSSTATQYPISLSDTEYLSYDGFFDQTYETIQYEGSYRLSFVSVKPVYREKLGQEFINVSAALVGTIRALYRRKATKPPFAYAYPEVFAPYIIGGLKGKMPIDATGIEPATENVCYNRYYSGTEVDWAWADLRFAGVWGAETPRTEGHFFNPHVGSTIDLLLLSDGVGGTSPVLYSTSPYLCAGFDADYPTALPDGYYREFSTGFARLYGRPSGVLPFYRPTDNGTLRPTGDSVQGVLPVEQGLSLLLSESYGSSVWRVCENG